MHIGNHVRKDLFIQTIQRKEYPDSVLFQNDVQLLQWSIPSPEVSNGGALFVETVWQNVNERKDDILVLIGLEKNGEMVTMQHFSLVIDGIIWKTGQRQSGIRQFPVHSVRVRRRCISAVYCCF